ncbi:MAG: YncE family protein, partial [Ignavibacteria bacterium]
MSKKFYLILVIILAIYFYSCSREEIVNIPVITTQGVFVLYEGVFNQPGSGDYSFIHLSSGNVDTNVFQNSNNGANLGLFPDGMVLHLNQNLYITSQGNFGQQGRMFKINAANNQLLDTVSFGVNPYNFTLADNNLYVTNIGGNSVTKLDLDLNVVSSIPVGPNPQDIIYALGNLYISKASYTTEYSVAIINVINNQVSNVFFNAPPVSVANNIGGVYVSTYSNKKLYVLDSLVSNQINDSISIPVQNAAIGDIIAGNPRTLYIVGVSDTAFFSNIGKTVYKFDILSRTLDSNFLIQSSGSDDIYGISYEPFSRRIYIANSRGGNVNGEVRIYDENGVLLNSYNDIG